jgi:hypothetical protein
MIRFLLVLSFAFFACKRCPCDEGDLRDCGDFDRQFEAQDCFNQCPGDPHKLDNEGDRLVCEELLTCPCFSGDTLNCDDFSSSTSAQICFDDCFPLSGDVHDLDGDGDGSVCE